MCMLCAQACRPADPGTSDTPFSSLSRNLIDRSHPTQTGGLRSISSPKTRTMATRRFSTLAVVVLALELGLLLGGADAFTPISARHGPLRPSSSSSLTRYGVWLDLR